MPCPIETACAAAYRSLSCLWCHMSQRNRPMLRVNLNKIKNLLLDHLYVFVTDIANRSVINETVACAWRYCDRACLFGWFVCLWCSLWFLVHRKIKIRFSLNLEQISLLTFIYFSDVKVKVQGQNHHTETLPLAGLATRLYCLRYSHQIWQK